ncbi:hypothetical protein ACNH6C_13770 [Bdellovibrio bacteriovorus]|uniref:hypothetical protein n=1 Tax=Bdellovibrio bacteriovorus TaxID=959 RepID=UPI003A7FEB8F
MVQESNQVNGGAMFLIRNLSGYSLDVLLGAIRSSVKSILFVEAAAGAKEHLSPRAKALLLKLEPWLIEKRFLWQEHGYSSFGYFFESSPEAVAIVLQESSTPTDWVYPQLFDNLNFLRDNGHSILYCSGMTDEVSLFLTSDELENFKSLGLFEAAQVLSFQEFLSDKSNEFSGGFNWDIVVGYGG